MSRRRLDPLTGEWRTFMDARQERALAPEGCPLCPTIDEARPTDVPWPEFEVVVLEDGAARGARLAEPVAERSLYEEAVADGAHEVVVYSDDHAASLATVGQERVRLVVDVWSDRLAALGAGDEVGYVFVFEERGGRGGALHHPHAHIQTHSQIPPVAGRELEQARAHLAERGTCLLCDVLAREQGEGVRIVAQCDAFVAFVPFAPRFAYEVHVAARRHAPSLLDLSDPERDDLASMLVEVVARYESLFGLDLPYVMAVHQAPMGDGDWQPVSHLHVEFTPVDSAVIRAGWLSGPALGLGAFVNDVAPEEAATALRAARLPSAGSRARAQPSA